MVRYLDIKINHGNRATTHDLKGAPVASTNSFDAHGTLEVGENSYEIYRLAAVDGSALLGYAVLDADSGEVDAVFVAPEHHGRGIGQMLLRWVEERARAAGLERLFLSASLNAVPFYTRAGFAALCEEMYPHRSGLAIPSMTMEKRLD